MSPKDTEIVATQKSQGALADRLIDTAESFARSTLTTMREQGLPDPDSQELAVTCLNWVHALEFLHVAARIPGFNPEETPDTLRHMLANPATGTPATPMQLLALVQFTLPLSRTCAPWMDEPEEWGDVPEGRVLDVPEMGQVHEKIMDVFGEIPAVDSVAVARDAKTTNGCFLAPLPVEEPALIASQIIDKATGEPVVYPAGEFVMLRGGKNRRRSASFYTPEVLADFTVRQGLEEYEALNNPAADDWLTMTISEPAIGTGAIASRAVRQIAEKYLQAKQTELGRTIPEDEYVIELQRVKSHVARNQLHGTDLNTNAVKIAELCLWLDTIIPKRVQ